MERSILFPTKAQKCICCGEDIGELLARCVNCNGFLCQKGVDLHKTYFIMKSHQIVSMDALKAEKAGARKRTKFPTCSKHKNRTLLLFCETCEVLICQACTVLDHCRPKHKYLDLDSVIERLKGKIRQLVGDCDAVASQINEELTHLTTIRANLDSAVTQATLEIDKAVDTLKKHIERLGKDQKQKLNKWKTERTDYVTKTTDDLESQSARLRTAQSMAKQILAKGSNCDIASLFSLLTVSLQELSECKPVPQTNALFEAKFAADTRVALSSLTLGTLAVGVPQCTLGTWVLERTIDSSSPGELSDAIGITVTLDGDIAVASFIASTPVKIFSPDGQFKFAMDKKSEAAWDIACTGNGNAFVTTGSCKYVKVFNALGQYLTRFPVMSPDGVSSMDDEDPYLRGIAVSANGYLLVGESTKDYISVHDQDGTHLHSIKTNIYPRFIAVTRDNHFIVGSYNYIENARVHVYDPKGEQVCVICAPEEARTWDPAGICITQNNEICIANSGEGASGIYCFTTAGKSLGCIIKDVSGPRGIALLKDGEKMAVIDEDGKCVKIFAHKC